MTSQQDTRELLRWIAVAWIWQGQSPEEVAEVLGVGRASVYRWWSAYCDGGEEGLRTAPQSGRPPKLTGKQEAQVLGWLNQDAMDLGFCSSRWTAPRLARVIQQKLGVCLNPRYLNRWLARRRISPQIPQPVARERRQEVIDRWLARDWPRIKKTPLAGARP